MCRQRVTQAKTKDLHVYRVKVEVQFPSVGTGHDWSNMGASCHSTFIYVYSPSQFAGFHRVLTFLLLVP